MNNISVTEILELSVTERLRIVEDIWNSIAADSDKLGISDELRGELDRRMKSYEADPGAGVSWEQLGDRLMNSR
ncbi:MAG: addiction module protein [Acidobacteria bacterium]|nr:addiction module protein [Acidobacteriota bacterium]